MDKTLIEKYKDEMLKMYRSAKPQPTVAGVTANPSTLPDGTGGIIANVTALRQLYPLSNAKVTVFTGDYRNRDDIATAFTDQSGKTKVFTLPAPNRSLSQTAGADAKPYSTYNLLVQAEGYLDNIHLNIPVFSGVVSLQGSDMLLLETAGIDKEPQIYDESLQFDL